MSQRTAILVRILQTVGAVGVIASLRPIWWGFQRPTCPSLGSGGSRLPNPMYPGPGVLLTGFGIGLLVFASRRLPD